MDLTTSIIAGTTSSLIALFLVYATRHIGKRWTNRTLKNILGFSGDTCTISVASARVEGSPGLMSYRDAHAFAYLANLALRINIEAKVMQGHEPVVASEARDEFCVGGLSVNIRTKDIYRRYCPSLEFEKHADDVETFSIQGEKITCDENTEYSFLIKIKTKFGATVHLIFGSSGLGTAGAAYYLFTKFKEIHRTAGKDPYFLVLSCSRTFGFKSTVLHKDYSHLL